MGGGHLPEPLGLTQSTVSKHVALYAPMHRYLGNTLLITVTWVIGAAVTSSLAAYAFARLRAPGKNTIFLLRQFFMTIPMDLEDAALIDGCGRFRTWISIIVPLAKPALATVTVFAFMGGWNDYMGPLIYLSNKRQYTMSLGLQVFTREHGAEWGMLMAASSMMVAPIMLLFFFAQKNFVQGITMTGMKG